MIYLKYPVAILRSAMFWSLFLVLSVVCTLLAYPLSFVSKRGFVLLCHSWSYGHYWLAHWVAGQRTVIEGDLPRGAYLYVLKHESMYEAVSLAVTFELPVVFIKAELFRLPFWNRVLSSYGHIAVDRAGGAKALRVLRAEAHKVRDVGRPLVLFPEGTRVPHGQDSPLRAGFAGIYSLLDIDVVPIALDSGRLHSAKGWLKWSGKVRYRVGEIVPAGLPRREAEARVHRAINALN